ncbi:hypothetical protein ABC766_32090 (plasmid) [Methylobacterium fujisawaense]|uniref:hypothetical protein n=1 Tax=Methylobacterium fujisawaense TaxID=107400 RepID=UPI0031F5BF0B
MKHVRIPDFSHPVPPRPALAAVERNSGSNALSNNRKTASRFSGAEPVRVPVDRRYRNLPDEQQPGAIEPWEAVAPVRPDTAHSRSLRFLDATGELLAAVAIIAGGMVLTGLATLL